jgi:hypothetical protein
MKNKYSCKNISGLRRSGVRATKITSVPDAVATKSGKTKS